jgi:DNA invertase Pin-like site-specific DNA recombinase
MDETTSSRRMSKRPTTAETERIARECPTEGLSVGVIVAAIQRETGCSRATAYRAVSDAFAAGILTRKENAAS